MTRDEILSMPAGRELDALVAETVMGLTLWYGDPTGYKIAENNDWWRDDYRNSDGEYCHRCPWYSADIAAAWGVIEKMKEKYSPALLFEDGEWECLFMAHYACAKSPSAPLAICHAALLLAEMTHG